MVQHQQEEARGKLADDLNNYASDDSVHRAFLQRWGVTDTDFEKMDRCRRDLLNTENSQDFAAWQRNFESRFLEPLDRAATNAIREYAALTAMKTAICPFAVLDMAVVIYMGTYMIGTLCRVYRLRAGPLDMLYLFALVMGQAFFAERAEEQSEEMAKWIDSAHRRYSKRLDKPFPI